MKGWGHVQTKQPHTHPHLKLCIPESQINMLEVRIDRQCGTHMHTRITNLRSALCSVAPSEWQLPGPLVPVRPMKAAM